RFALISLALSDRPDDRGSDMELVRPGPSYTTDTLRALHAEGWRPSQLFFILGTDALADIARARGVPSLLELAQFVVMERPGTAVADAVPPVPEVRSRAIEASTDERLDAGFTRVILVHARTRDVSSTQIRARLAAGQPIDDLVPPSVARHIVKHHLYGA